MTRKFTIETLLDVLEFSTKIYVYDINDSEDILYEGIVKELEFYIYKELRDKTVVNIMPDKDELYIDVK